ncbi:cytochrome b N-terminal domain-containing protein [Glycomyces sp. L485]|uniref:cytochrome b N-terminal domain-containing protein n=1 Tax=Glycomyces sp. L485 TaxID=2909235 RepID=UPI001F4B770D|nr:cytochrome b N-terminal domain-containing protein [Glycomyces sp. L485]MCH7229429.1 cytochrome b N-terminal domain-containing protein [Glycomyces sp. L485]
MEDRDVPAPVPQRRRGPGRRLIGAVDERLGVDALRYPVPEHANNLGWSLGGLTAFTFVILLVTGVYLAQFYNPTPEAANQSVREISTDVWLGEFTRSLHFWSANAMVLLVILHLLRVVLHGSYKRPREGNFLVGVTMFALVIGGMFTGTVLKWDQEGFEALLHNIEVAYLLGGLGFWLTPEAAANLPILVRLYSAHLMLVPGLIIVLLVLHALLVKRHGISAHPSIPGRSRELDEPFTHHLRRVGAFGLVLLGFLGLLSVLIPPIIGATPVEGIEVTRPPWMFWWLYTLENWFGLRAILWASVGLGVLLVLLPFIDRGPEREWRRRPFVIAAVGLVVLLLIVLSLLVLVTEPEQHL